MRYKITAGDDLETDYADTRTCATKRAKKLAFKYKGEVVVTFDTLTESNAFTMLAPINCTACED